MTVGAKLSLNEPHTSESDSAPASVYLYGGMSKYKIPHYVCKVDYVTTFVARQLLEVCRPRYVNLSWFLCFSHGEEGLDTQFWNVLVNYKHTTKLLSQHYR